MSVFGRALNISYRREQCRSFVEYSLFCGVVEKYHDADQQQQQSGDETARRRQPAVRRTTMMTTTLSLPRASQEAPIIVLHEAPVSTQLNAESLQLPVTPTHHRRHARRHSITSSTAQTLPEVLLAPGVLETIVINNGCVGMRRSMIGSRSMSGSRSGSRSRSGCGSAVTSTSVTSANCCRSRSARRSSLTTLQPT